MRAKAGIRERRRTTSVRWQSRTEEHAFGAESRQRSIHEIVSIILIQIRFLEAFGRPARLNPLGGDPNHTSGFLERGEPAEEGSSWPAGEQRVMEALSGRRQRGNFGLENAENVPPIAPRIGPSSQKAYFRKYPVLAKKTAIFDENSPFFDEKWPFLP